MSYNKVILEGHLCRDIELKYASNTGKPYARSAIAVNSVSGSGENKRESVCFIDLTFFGRTAEVANQYLKKGAHILIDGELQFEQWQNQNGENRSKHSVIVQTLQMLGTKNSNENSNEFSSPAPVSAPQKQYNENGDEIPF